MTGKVAIITKESAPRWIPPAEYTAQFRFADAKAARSTLFRIGVNKEALAYPDPPPSLFRRLFRRTPPDQPSGSPTA